MNHLAHLFLAEDHAASRIGNLLGDFVTGRPESIDLPPAVVAGIVRHRAVDRFTDAHPAVVRARGMFEGELRRFANPLVDISFDHFLASSWRRHSPLSLREFLDRAYAEQKTHREWLPAALAASIDARIADDWLGRYGDFGQLEQVFLRIARRSHRFEPLTRAFTSVRRRREGLAGTFETFFPDLVAWNHRQGPEGLAFPAGPAEP